jgi:hypothetical protein
MVGIAIAIGGPMPMGATVMDVVCPSELLGKPYVFTDSDWKALVLAAPRLREIEVADNAEMVDFVDMTKEGEPTITSSYRPGQILKKIATAHARSLDLNRDGTDEVFLLLSSPLTCSNGVAVCPIFVLDDSASRRVLLDSVGHCLVVEDTMRDGWADVGIVWLGADYVVRQDTYTFHSPRYAQSDRRVIGALRMEN